MKMNTFTFRESFDRAPYRKNACVFESRFLTHALRAFLGSPQANWKRKVKRAVADLKNVALNTKVEAKTVERRFTANLNGAMHQMNQSFSLKLSAAKAKATRAQAILSRKYESMLEKIRDSYAELGGTGQSNAQKAEALDLAEQVASLQTISVTES